ncbi:uncharacterized protein PHACADRAFT_205787 [Phanerochaete carnosa HHB-10118-sp]|uniref:TrmE-type G domain-containing protein n=1 Tax=Phanerochaete carnosa (strain HHB-10118-sp) TaxID=650164 RepID=K5W6L2_PHACS|nr:uncharacterized protein PHACADRAFT_205787 [Phanerochaete carnosa HHB-10118-sp]EKM59568.1 hypothetical protein PHACADRAFT_205787 [Phanerochaete carnosa HHB-10118-sp]
MLSRWASKISTKHTPKPGLLRSSAHHASFYAPAPRRSPESPWQARNNSVNAGLSPAWSLAHLLPSESPSSGLVQSDAQRNTIYALSTPPGKAGVAVIRVSGPDALNVWQSMVSKSSKRNTTAKAEKKTGQSFVPKPWRMYRCQVVHPQSKEVLDSGLAVYFRGPRSFTGEDTVEFHVHSGRAILNSVLSALSTFASLRLAEPGEFTRRTFESGRLDLTEVEGLHDLINADTSSQRQAALQAVGGVLKHRFESLRGTILRSLSLVEAVIDFGEEEVEDDVYQEAKALARRARTDVQLLLADYRRSEIVRSGLRLAIFGPPNAGKSTLLNFLAKREAAIVTNIPGTTRDVLEVTLDLGGLPVIVSDTAGIRSTDDVVEKIGIERAIEAVEKADVKLCVLDVAELDKAHPASEELITIMRRIKPFLLVNKIDSEVSSPPQATFLADQKHGVAGAWAVSLRTGMGIETFMNELGMKLHETYATHLELQRDDAPLVINARHREHLTAALQFLDAFLGQGAKGVFEEESTGSPEDIVLAAEELRYAAQAIGAITGRIDVEDILDTIFREFCIGK